MPNGIGSIPKNSFFESEDKFEDDNLQPQTYGSTADDGSLAERYVFFNLILMAPLVLSYIKKIMDKYFDNWSILEVAQFYIKGFRLFEKYLEVNKVLLM